MAFYAATFLGALLAHARPSLSRPAAVDLEPVLARFIAAAEATHPGLGLDRDAFVACAARIVADEASPIDALGALHRR